MIKEDPEDATGYLCLSHVYYFGFRQIDEASKYLEEALKIDHLDENVLLTALDIFYAQENFERLKEIAEIGIKKLSGRRRILLLCRRGKNTYRIVK
ncbi:hypothetical protein ACT7C3_15090 [Bacillus pacificus]